MNSLFCIFLFCVNFWQKSISKNSMGITGLQQWLGDTVIVALFWDWEMSSKFAQWSPLSKNLLTIVPGQNYHLNDIHQKRKDWNLFFICVNSNASWRQKCKLPLKWRSFHSILILKLCKVLGKEINWTWSLSSQSLPDST